MTEILYEMTYSDCTPYGKKYRVEKETTPEMISIIVYDSQFDHNNEITRISYKNVGVEYCSPFLSWYNLLFCSNNYNLAPDYDYMTYAVQKGKKTASTVYFEPDSDEGKEIIAQLPRDCSALPYGSKMIYVFHRGCLSSFFDFDAIKSIYDYHMCFCIDWSKVRELMDKPLDFFGHEGECGFSIQSGGTPEQNVINGLLLGYPVESTVYFIKGWQ